MKDFDKAREERRTADRTFKLGGETFVMKAGVRPEVLARYDSLGKNTAPSEVLEVVDGIVLEMIEPQGDNGDTEKAWKALREREEDAVTLADLIALVEWLIEEQTGQRPTQQPSPSSAGRGRPKRPSTAASS